MGFNRNLGNIPQVITELNGNIGVAATGPSTLLQIGTGGGAGATNSIAYLGGYSSGVSQLRYIMNHNGAANAGIGTPSAGGILFGYGLVDGTVSGEWMRINTSGNVGIGTNSPQVKLHVARTDSGEVARFSAPNGYIPYILLGRPDATNEGLKLSYDSNNGNTSFETVSSHNMLFKNNNTERMRIASSGNVGIGTTNPLNKLVISNSGAQGLEIGADATYNVNLAAYNRATSAYIPFQIDASKFSFLTGNVLIGTTSDNGQKLQVNGSITATSLALAGNYSVDVTTNSGWSSYQNIINPGTLLVGVTYMISIRWNFSSGSNQPYYCYCSFLWVGVSTNGPNTDNEFTPICSTHTGGTGANISFRSIAGYASSTGLQARLNSFPTLGGVMTVKAIRLE